MFLQEQFSSSTWSMKYEKCSCRNTVENHRSIVVFCKSFGYISHFGQVYGRISAMLRSSQNIISTFY